MKAEEPTETEAGPPFTAVKEDSLVSLIFTALKRGADSIHRRN
jgi:hypothetical protein